MARHFYVAAIAAIASLASCTTLSRDDTVDPAGSRQARTDPARGMLLPDVRRLDRQDARSFVFILIDGTTDKERHLAGFVVPVKNERLTFQDVVENGVFAGTTWQCQYAIEAAQARMAETKLDETLVQLPPWLSVQHSSVVTSLGYRPEVHEVRALNLRPGENLVVVRCNDDAFCGFVHWQRSTYLSTGFGYSAFYRSEADLVECIASLTALSESAPTVVFTTDSASQTDLLLPFPAGTVRPFVSRAR